MRCSRGKRAPCRVDLVCSPLPQDALPGASCLHQGQKHRPHNWRWGDQYPTTTRWKLTPLSSFHGDSTNNGPAPREPWPNYLNARQLELKAGLEHTAVSERQPVMNLSFSKKLFYYCMFPPCLWTCPNPASCSHSTGPALLMSLCSIGIMHKSLVRVNAKQCEECTF